MTTLGDSRSIAASPLVVLSGLLPLVLGCQTVSSNDDGMRWSDPELIEDGAANAQRPQIAADPTGGFIAVWDQTDRDLGGLDGSDDIWARRFDSDSDSDSGWQDDAKRMEDLEPDETFGAQIGIADDGSAIAVFVHEEQEENPVLDTSLWAVHFSQGLEREPERCIQSTPGDPECRSSGVASNPRVAVDPRGNAVAVWEQSEGPDSDSSIILANRFTPGSDWSGATTVVDNVQTAAKPQVAIDANGNAIVVWEQVDATERSSIWSRRLPSGGGRPETAQSLEKDDNRDAFGSEIAMDGDGNAIAVWRQQLPDEARFAVFANRYDPSTGTWESLAKRISDQTTGNAQAPQIAMAANGHATAVWAVSGGDREGVWSNRYTPGNGWGQPVSISRIGLGSVRDPRITTDGEGNAVAVWVQFEQFAGLQDRIWSNRYASNRGWGASLSVETDEEETPFRSRAPRVAMDPSGKAVAIWVRADDLEGIGNLWSNHLESQAASEASVVSD